MKFVILICVLFFVFVILKFVLDSSSRISKEEVLPYKAKRYFFSGSEQEFFRILNERIKNGKYVVFPKVRLADFIEVIAKREESRGWLNKIKSKHVDFLIWDTQGNKIALALELDGNSHNSDKMKERDVFVNELYKTVGIRLERVSVGVSFADEVERIVSTLEIQG